MRTEKIMATPIDPTRLAFRPCTRADFPMIHRWFHEPHAKRWFARHDETLEDVAREFGSYLDGVEPIAVYIVTLESVPIGMMQWVRVGDFPWLMEDYALTEPDAVNCDVLIGEPTAVHRGLGVPMILKFLREVVYPTSPALGTCFIDPEKENAIAIRVYGKAGFRFVRDVKDDEGVEVYLMAQSRAEIVGADSAHAPKHDPA